MPSVLHGHKLRPRGLSPLALGTSALRPTSRHEQPEEAEAEAELIIPAIKVTSQHRLRSAYPHRLTVPCCRLNMYVR